MKKNLLHFVFFPLFIFTFPPDFLDHSCYAQTLSVPKQPAELIVIEGGGGMRAGPESAYRWSLNAQYVIDGSGGFVGLAWQGTYPGYRASPDAPPSNLRPIDFQLGYGYPRWRSHFKSSGFAGSVGPNTVERSPSNNVSWHFSLYANLVYSINLGSFSAGVYVRPMLTFLLEYTDNSDHTTSAHDTTERQANFGLHLSYRN